MVRWKQVLKELTKIGKPMTMDALFERLVANKKLIEDLRWTEKAEDRQVLKASIGTIVRDMYLVRGVIDRQGLGKGPTGHELYEYSVLAVPRKMPKKPSTPFERSTTPKMRRRPANRLPERLDHRRRYEEAHRKAKDLPHGTYALPDYLIIVSAAGVRTWRPA